MSTSIVITGASSGIGRACAVAAADRGWRVLAVARREDRLRSLAEEIGCETLVADLTRAEDVSRLAIAASDFGADTLVNVAGGAKGLDPVETTSDDDWRWMFEANVLATKNVTGALLPQLRRATEGGSYATIMTVTSIAATMPYSGGSGYNAAKAAEKALTDVLRLEVSGEPIRVMEVRPGLVKTEEFSLVRFGGDQERAAKVYEDVQDPLSAEDVARVMTDLLALPGHVSVDETTIKPVAQTHAWLLHKGPLQAK
ncbi:MAG TPA: SDR family NAD(P)-dependent oxidoreductase [Candidatus Agrococcus pullicola]|uniref:SDR family NAD(P)-dependent oxidoreductase n=1 Tax=Candidatus Agrococcus pullicola TaxID=2838429 RepID=A0A9D2C964_9MICO|nr:SDR family NAD(P)-dependent oxidoreductase [Candidatus Agrococcus pullicola]